MIFYRVTDAQPAVDYLANKISLQLNAGKKVFWLLSGGSTAGIGVEASKLLPKDLSNLTVSLIDERFGSVGHEDSNWEFLISNGLKLTGANLKPILTGQSFETTVQAYERVLNSGLKMDYTIALMGIGPDSHVAGIKSGSPAIAANSLAYGYDWQDYKGRITMTFAAIKQLDCSVSYLAAETKRLAIQNLQKDLPLEECPSQILKAVKEAIIFNDLMGEELT